MDKPLAYGDASHAWEPVHGWGTMGYVVMLYGGPVSWRTKSIKIIVRNTRDAEAFAMCAATEATLWLRMWMDTFGYIRENDPSIVLSDSSALVQGMADGSFNTSRKAIMQAGRLMRQVIKEGEIVMYHIAGVDNISDILTKAEARDRHSELSGNLVGSTPLDLSTAGKVAYATAKDFR